MQRDEILDWLRETDPARLADLWRLADRTRQEYVGGEVHLRGLIELSNYCVRLCGYCGLRAGNVGLTALSHVGRRDHGLRREGRRVSATEPSCSSRAKIPELTRQRIAGLVERIKAETPLAVTLSLGERDDEELAAWRQAGADRYLLRFETSNRTLYERIHPPRAEQSAPIAIGWRFSATLRRLGYEVGSGVMIGIPGQTYDDLADDIELFARLDLDMIGVGPYLRHPDTPLADRDAWPDAADGRQVPASEEMTYKVIALARLACPRANIPATTALATLNTADGRELGLVRGANVVMPNLRRRNIAPCTKSIPTRRALPRRGEACHHCLTARIEAIGRQPGRGPGRFAELSRSRISGRRHVGRRWEWSDVVCDRHEANSAAAATTSSTRSICTAC